MESAIVSEDVLEAAHDYAIAHAGNFAEAEAMRIGFIAGAAFMKPIEHELKPTYGNGKESEDHTDDL